MHTEGIDANRDLDRIVGSAYDLHRSRLQRYLTSITRDPSVAEDLVQDAFVRLMVETSAGRVPDDIGAWLHRVAHNLAMSRGRRLSVADRRLSELAIPDPPRSPEQVALALERRREVEAAVADLGPSQRDAMLLAALGFRGDEIARSIGRTDGATRTLLCRARAKTKAALLGLQLA